MPFWTGSRSAMFQVGTLAGCLLPITTTLFAALLSLQPVPFPGYTALTPALTLMAIYHWTIYRPDLLPPFALFGIGVAYDLLSGGPPGVTALLFLVSRAAVLRCRRRFLNRAFPLIWGGFTVLTAGAMFGSWLLHSLLAFHLFSLNGSIICTILSSALFPIFSFLLGRTQHALIGAG
jgi:rod shape-determining protein MreD